MEEKEKDKGNQSDIKIDEETAAIEAEERAKRRERRRRRRRRRRKDEPSFDMPGVYKITLSELTQKIVNCLVGEDVTVEKPFIYVRKELIQDNIELHEESSQFLPIRNEILKFPRNEVLLVYSPDESGGGDDFFICATEEATDKVAEIIKEMQKKQEERLYNAIYKLIKPWTSLGSEAEVEETIVKNNRTLLEVEIESKYPILPYKVEYRFRTVEKCKDGYMELNIFDDSIQHIQMLRIDMASQVAPSVMCNEAQTICTYPSNSATQYENLIKLTPTLWPKCMPFVEKYILKNYEMFRDMLTVNRGLNLYTDDYQDLIKTKNYDDLSTLQGITECVAFNDVHFCKGKMVTCANWNRITTGIVAISYGDIAPSIYFNKLIHTDEVLKAIHSPNPVLVWTFVDPLNARLTLESNREISSVSFCPFDESVVIGGCVNGQIIIWDIKNKIKRVEEVEILTNAQQKYRNYMFSLMHWMKNIKDLSLVRPTALSDLRHSHTGSVVRIQWISPYQEITKNGKGRDLAEDEPMSLQFMSASEGGEVLIWDLLKKPTLQAGGFRAERKLKRLKKRPSALTVDVSPFRALHMNLKPIYRLNIPHMKVQKQLALSAFAFDQVEVDYVLPEGVSKAKTMWDRVQYEAVPKRSDKGFNYSFHLGSMEGDFLQITWEGRDFDLGEVVNHETVKFVQCAKYHDGPIITISKHPKHNIFLTIGGKIFAIWTSSFPNKPIFWRKSKVIYTGGSWRKEFPAKIRLLRVDGLYESWSLTTMSKKAMMISALSSAALTSSNIHPRDLPSPVIGITDAHGSFRIFRCLAPRSGDEKAEAIATYVEREQKRKLNFLRWQEHWCKKHIVQEVTEEAKPPPPPPTEEVDEAAAAGAEAAPPPAPPPKEEKPPEKADKSKEKDKDKGRDPGRYLEWVREKQQAKEQERIKTMILQKKSLDTEELIKQRKPLLKMEAENEIRKKKQRARLRDSENIFKETVAMLFPAIVKEKRAPSPDPYSGGDSEEAKQMAFNQYMEYNTRASKYVSTHPYVSDFDWKTVLIVSKKRRRYLDNSYWKSTHHNRMRNYKYARKRGEAEPYYAKEFPQQVPQVPAESKETNESLMTEEDRQ